LLSASAPATAKKNGTVKVSERARVSHSQSASQPVSQPAVVVVVVVVAAAANELLEGSSYFSSNKKKNKFGVGDWLAGPSKQAI